MKTPYYRIWQYMHYVFNHRAQQQTAAIFGHTGRFTELIEADYMYLMGGEL